MADIIFIAIIVAFFALSVLLVRACDRIIGPDEQVKVAKDQAPTVDRMAA